MNTVKWRCSWLLMAVHEHGGFTNKFHCGADSIMGSWENVTRTTWASMFMFTSIQNMASLLTNLYGVKFKPYEKDRASDLTSAAHVRAMYHDSLSRSPLTEL